MTPHFVYTQRDQQLSSPNHKAMMINNLFMQVKSHLRAYRNVRTFPEGERPQNNSCPNSALNQSVLADRRLCLRNRKQIYQQLKHRLPTCRSGKNAYLWHYVRAALADFTTGTKKSEISGRWRPIPTWIGIGNHTCTQAFYKTQGFQGCLGPEMLANVHQHNTEGLILNLWNHWAWCDF